MNVKPKNIEECANYLREHGRLSAFQYVKYDKLNEQDQNRDIMSHTVVLARRVFSHNNFVDLIFSSKSYIYRPS